MRSRTALFSLVVLGVAVGGCLGPTPTETAPTPVPTIIIQTFDGRTCLLAALPPRPITFRIDPTSAPEFMAIDTRGRPHDVIWAEGFVPGTVDDPVVRDPAGEIIVRNGEVLSVADDDRLHGYMVCSGGDRVYILLLGRTTPSG